MKILVFSFIFFVPIIMLAQKSQEKIIYLIPGQGSDGRLFKNINIEKYKTKVIKYTVPVKGETMASYARRLSSQIDTTKRYSIVGVSLGGMLAVEMSKVMRPEEVILIASAKTKNEIPKLYSFFRKFPVYKLFGGNFYKYWTIVLQPLYEPMDKEYQKLWRHMLLQKNPKFMKRAVRCIIEWDNEEYDKKIIQHIHGTKDKTLPVKNIHGPILIENGTHVMTLTKGKEISKIINMEIMANNGH
ncbi:MAG TPA: alpha/beta hydrolase [Bacteroidetes bacterium]|nr:alpha/beta hydrolase [Bacteroidota bacterium]